MQKDSSIFNAHHDIISNMEPNNIVPPQFSQPVINGAPQQAPTMYPDANNTSTSRGKKKLPLIVVSVLVVLAIVCGAFVVFHKKNNNTGGGSTASTSDLSSQLSLLSKYGGKLTAGDVSKFNKTSLFYAVFKNASMQNVVHVTSDMYEGNDSTDQSTRAYEFLHDSTFNYKTKQLALATQDTKGQFFSECVNGTEYEYEESIDPNTGSTVNSWSPSADNTCDMSDYAGYINDGINTGGLSASQAQTYVSGLAGANGLISVNSVSYATHAGAPYIRLVVIVNPINLGNDNGYEGMGVIGGWLKQAGINLTTWPYQSIGNIATGAQLIYYINPATQLPAYSQMNLTYSLSDSTGKQVLNEIYDFQDTQYAFGGTVTPLSTSAAPQAIKLSWPEEKSQP
jgi:hypothetical protein